MMDEDTLLYFRCLRTTTPNMTWQEMLEASERYRQHLLNAIAELQASAARYDRYIACIHAEMEKEK